MLIISSRAKGKFEEAASIEATMKKKDISQCQPVFSNFVDLFNLGLKLSNWDSKM